MESPACRIVERNWRRDWLSIDDLAKLLDESVDHFELLRDSDVLRALFQTYVALGAGICPHAVLEILLVTGQEYLLLFLEISILVIWVRDVEFVRSRIEYFEVAWNIDTVRAREAILAARTCDMRV